MLSRNRKEAESHVQPFPQQPVEIIYKGKIVVEWFLGLQKIPEGPQLPKGMKLTF